MTDIAGRVVKLRPGDQVDILGHLFVLADLVVESGKPAVAVFKQPTELIEDTEERYCHLDAPSIPFGRPWCIDHNRPAHYIGPNGNRMVCKQFLMTYPSSSVRVKTILVPRKQPPQNEHCRTVDTDPPRGYRWCYDHRSPAVHKSIMGNHEVCIEFTMQHGCSCHKG